MHPAPDKPPAKPSSAPSITPLAQPPIERLKSWKLMDCISDLIDLIGTISNKTVGWVSDMGIKDSIFLSRVFVSSGGFCVCRLPALHL
jgi:hypothetical protein